MNGTRKRKFGLTLTTSTTLGETNVTNATLRRRHPTPICTRFSPIAAMKTQKKNSISKSHGICCDVIIAETMRIESRIRSPGSIKRLSKSASGIRCSKTAEMRHNKITSAGIGSVRFRSWTATTR